MMKGRPTSCAISLAARILAMLTGCPPPELFVTVIITAGMRSGPDLLDRSPQRLQVDVALEGVDQPRLPALGDDQVARFRATVLDMRPRRVEVRVVQHDIAGPGDHVEEDVLGRAALVRGDHVLEAGDVAHGRLEAIERRRARVRFVGGDHARPLAGRHRAGAAVGQQVDQHVLGLEQERIVAGFRQILLAFGAGGETDRLDRADAEWFDDGGGAGNRPWEASLAPFCVGPPIIPRLAPLPIRGCANASRPAGSSVRRPRRSCLNSSPGPRPA